VRGLEATWVQSLDFLLGDAGLDGFGFSVNGTYIDQDGSGAAPAIATGVARYAYNATFYYENHGIMARISTTWNEGSVSSGANQNGIGAASLFSDDYDQWDFSSSFDLAELFDTPNLPTVTFDVVNIFESSSVLLPVPERRLHLVSTRPDGADGVPRKLQAGHSGRRASPAARPMARPSRRPESPRAPTSIMTLRGWP
jgi:hypothetical protein